MVLPEFNFYLKATFSTMGLSIFPKADLIKNSLLKTKNQFLTLSGQIINKEKNTDLLTIDNMML